MGAGKEISLWVYLGATENNLVGLLGLSLIWLHHSDPVHCAVPAGALVAPHRRSAGPGSMHEAAGTAQKRELARMTGRLYQMPSASDPPGPGINDSSLPRAALESGTRLAFDPHVPCWRCWTP